MGRGGVCTYMHARAGRVESAEHFVYYYFIVRVVEEQLRVPKCGECSRMLLWSDYGVVIFCECRCARCALSGVCLC